MQDLPLQLVIGVPLFVFRLCWHFHNNLDLVSGDAIAFDTSLLLERILVLACLYFLRWLSLMYRIIINTSAWKTEVFLELSVCYVPDSFHVSLPLSYLLILTRVFITNCGSTDGCLSWNVILHFYWGSDFGITLVIWHRRPASSLILFYWLEQHL